MNSDYSKRVVLNEEELEYISNSDNTILKKLLSQKENQETAILEMAKNSQLNSDEKFNNVEILVLEGIYINELGAHPKGTYLKLSNENELHVKTISGCKIFRKVNYFENSEKLIIDTTSTLWQQGHGNLKVMPLDSQSALVLWPKNEKFIPHSHWGGEEIFVLYGRFMDEHGVYPQNSWIRSPHRSFHTPFVEEETLIYVKTGHI